MGAALRYFEIACDMGSDEYCIEAEIVRIASVADPDIADSPYEYAEINRLPLLSRMCGAGDSDRCFELALVWLLCEDSDGATDSALGLLEPLCREDCEYCCEVLRRVHDGWYELDRGTSPGLCGLEAAGSGSTDDAP